MEVVYFREIYLKVIKKKNFVLIQLLNVTQWTIFNFIRAFFLRNVGDLDTYSASMTWYCVTIGTAKWQSPRGEPIDSHSKVSGYFQSAHAQREGLFHSSAVMVTWLLWWWEQYCLVANKRSFWGVSEEQFYFFFFIRCGQLQWKWIFIGDCSAER